MEGIEKPDQAPDGYAWVCTACGKYSSDRKNLGDTSCVTWAELIAEERLLIAENRVLEILDFSI